jgi:hypothetical protein
MQDILEFSKLQEHPSNMCEKSLNYTRIGEVNIYIFTLETAIRKRFSVTEASSGI